MKILVDADACPVKEIIVKIATDFNLPVIMFFDSSHIYDDGYSDVIIVEKGSDSVDFALVNKVSKGDIVVTQDYGLATMALSKGAISINQNGLIYNQDNIDRLLFERYLSQKIRRAGGKAINPKKRTSINNDKFEEVFYDLCKNLHNK